MIFLALIKRANLIVNGAKLGPKPFLQIFLRQGRQDIIRKLILISYKHPTPTT